MKMDKKQLRLFTIEAQKMIDNDEPEDKLRHYLTLQLSRIFPDSPWWVEAHIMGTEKHVHFSLGGKNRNGYVDAVVGKTAIEYERNLKIQTIFDEGYYQVKEYCSALYNLKIPENEILGVLSDTVRWYGYKVKICGTVNAGQLYGPDNIDLIPVMTIDLSKDTNEEYSHFEQFINAFLARESSRLLNSETLSMDFGISSSFYFDTIDGFKKIVNDAMTDRPDYANLIENVWQNFIAYLGASDYGNFSVETYTNEFYLVTIAKILCADILCGRNLISSDSEINNILNGKYFSSQNIYNFVDYDYFGWLNDAPYVDKIIPYAKKIQSRLKAYDFSKISEEDIFGKLLAQLADKDHRLMLGQEFTPHWIAKEMVDYNLNLLNTKIPHALDMCCGSGVFLVEIIKAVRHIYDITATNFNSQKDDIAFSCVMGFDIDPLAVMLAKVNWILTMRDLFPLHSGAIIVPIYHADSLFVATPITHKMPSEDENFYALNFDGKEVKIPVFLLTPEYRRTFESFMSKGYKLAMIRAKSPISEVGNVPAQELVSKALYESKESLDESKKNLLIETAKQMVTVLENLQRAGRNGIWYFIISNSYRPGLTQHQFNCIISNPPWMAMSKLADNPYKNSLDEIARKYSIMPLGAAHPHMELATIFLASSVDKYLEEDGVWSCIMPASLLSGLNHENFRREKYKNSKAHLKMSVKSIWELPINTFKNKAIVLSGDKQEENNSSMLGRIYSENRSYQNCTYRTIYQGKRSAWTNKGKDTDVISVINGSHLSFAEGCDLMPRTALFHEFSSRANGNWNLNKIDRESDLWYLISDAKTSTGVNITASDFEDEYVYKAYISKNLSPFIMSEPANILIPAKRVNNVWKPISNTDLALMNESTSYVFDEISKLLKIDLKSYFDKINIYGKLVSQNFAGKDWLVLSNAGGTFPCASYISLSNLNKEKLVIDQTLYWYLADSEEEAIYVTGLINSEAVSNAISQFQPEGEFGKRHIHTLPYKIIPEFDPSDENHQNVVSCTRKLIKEWNDLCKTEKYKKLLNPNAGKLNSRRTHQKAAIKELQEYLAYQDACSAVFEE